MATTPTRPKVEKWHNFDPKKLPTSCKPAYDHLVKAGEARAQAVARFAEAIGKELAKANKYDPDTQRVVISQRFGDKVAVGFLPKAGSSDSDTLF